MKTFRLLAAALFLSMLGPVAPAQESSEVSALRAKAEKGNGIAQYNLGLAYAEGRGIAADPIEAFVWLSLARENGARGRALDNVVASLDKASFEAAQQRLAERKGTAVVKAAPAPVTRTAPAPKQTPVAVTPEARPTPPASEPAPVAPAVDLDALAAEKKQLSSEVAQALKEIEGLKAELAEAKTQTAPDLMRLRQERDTLSTKLTELSTETATLRNDRDRLQTVAAQAEKDAHSAGEAARAAQESARASETRIGELVRNAEAAATELARAKQSLAALEQAPRPASDSAVLEQKTRELQSVTSELEASRAFGRKVEDTLNQVNDQKTRELQAAAAELEASRNFGRQVEDTLNKVNDQKAALEQKLAAAQSAASETGRQTEGLKAATSQLAAMQAELTQAKADLAEQSRKANGQIESLNTQLADSQQKLAEAQSRVASSGQQTAAQLKARETELAQLRTSQGELTSRLQQLTEEKSALEKKLATKDAGAARLRELESSLAAASQRAEAGEADRGRLQKEVAGLNEKLAARPSAPAYPDLSGRVSELESQLAGVRDTVSNTTKAADALKAQLLERDTQLQAAQSDVQLLGQKLKQADIAMNQAQESSSALQAEADKLRTRPAAPAYPDLSGKVTELETKLAAAEKATTEKPATPLYPDLSGKVGELEGQVAVLTNSAAASAKELAALTKAKEDAQAQIGTLTVERDAARTAQNELGGALTKLEQEKNRLTTAQAPSAETSRQLAELGQKVAAAEKQSATLRQERDALSAKITDLAENLATLQSDRERMQKLLADSGRKLRDSADTASRVKELETQAAGFQTSLAALSSEASQAKQQVTALTKAKEDAEAQANGLTSERDAARVAQNELRETIARLEQEKKQLANAQNTTPAYPDLSGKVHELETQRGELQAAVATATARLSELTLTAEEHANLAANLQVELKQAQNTIAAKSSAPAYPDLSGRVNELEAKLAAANQQADTAAQTAATASKQSTADLNAATEQIARLKTALAEKSSAPAYPDLSGKVNELESTVAESARQLAAAGTAQAELQRQLADATTAQQNATKTKGGDDAQLRRERDELSGRVAELAGEVAQLRTDRERMQKLLADSGKQLRDSTADASRIKELETQTTGLQSSLASVSSEASQAKEQINALTKAKEETQAQVTSLQNSLATKSAAPAYPDLSGKVSELETQLSNLQATLAAKPAAPVYPDLSGRVSELEAQLAASKHGNAPVYPNLASRVVELETALADSKRQLADTQTSLHAAEQAKAAPVAAEANPTDLQKQLAETEDKLATALRGYTLLEQERDAQAAKASQAAGTVTAERNTLAAQVATLTSEVEQLKAGAQSSSGASQAEISRLNESLTALQHSTAQNASDLAATRALLQQIQGANAVLAGENYQLKTMLARSTGAPGPVKIAPATIPTARVHVVAAGDSLSRISQHYYGTANRWQEIYNANRDKIGPDGVLRIGTDLRIP